MLPGRFPVSFLIEIFMSRMVGRGMNVSFREVQAGHQQEFLHRKMRHCNGLSMKVGRPGCGTQCCDKVGIRHGLDPWPGRAFPTWMILWFTNV